MSPRRLLSACLVFFACLTSFFGFAATAHAAPANKPATRPTIAVFELYGQLGEQQEDGLNLFAPPPPTLRDVEMRMKKAAEDPEVKAVVLLTDGLSFGFAQAEEIRQAMQRLQSAGKPVYAQSDSLMMGQYILLSGASRLSVAPTGDLFVSGFYGDAPYLHGLLEKIGVHAEFLHCGAYKSAAEIFMRDGPSPEADEMQNWLLDSLYGSSIHLIASGRKVGEDKVRGWIDTGLYTAEKAKAAGLIDAVEDREGLEAAIRQKVGSDAVFDKRYGVPKQPTLDLSNPFGLLRTFAEMMNEKKSSGKPAIGIVYVDGMIVPGRSEPSLFGSSFATSTDISNALDKAARDDSVKAVVLRIDSPGGSAVASQIILDATKRVKAKKPFVVSMGDVAGSGGYFVACGADTIFADQTTITGSIGVVGGKFVTTDMWNKIGVTWKPYQRGAHANLLSTDAPFSNDDRQRLQSWMNEIYDVFKGHVTTIRGDRLKKSIDDLAGGRVYTGKQALDLGLVDKIGTLQDAIEFAASQAKVTDYDVHTVPEPKNFVQQLMEQAAGGENDPNHITLGRPAALGAQGDSLLRLAAPYLQGLDPTHVKKIEAALEQLQLMQREGVIMMMPMTYSCGK